MDVRQGREGRDLRSVFFHRELAATLRCNAPKKTKDVVLEVVMVLQRGRAAETAG
jgi:hypothetical protein